MRKGLINNKFLTLDNALVFSALTSSSELDTVVGASDNLNEKSNEAELRKFPYNFSPGSHAVERQRS